MNHCFFENNYYMLSVLGNYYYNYNSLDKPYISNDFDLLKKMKVLKHLLLSNVVYIQNIRKNKKNKNISNSSTKPEYKPVLNTHFIHTLNTQNNIVVNLFYNTKRSNTNITSLLNEPEMFRDVCP